MTQLHSFAARPDAARPLLSVFRAVGLGVGLGVSLLFSQASWAAPVVSYKATNLVDTTFGQDLWKYDYSFTGPINAGGSLNLIFSYLNYAGLVSTTADSNLTLLPIQPDTGLGTDGIVFVIPTMGLASTDTSMLSVQFVWLGGGRTPGSQSFEIFDAEFNRLDGGETTAPRDGNVVPEPASMGLVMAALLGACVARRRKA